MEKLIKSVADLRAKASEGGGPAVLERWKARGKGKLGARERCVLTHIRRWENADGSRVDALLDPGSPFLELCPLAGHDVYPDPLPGAGLVTGIGRHWHLRQEAAR